MSCRHREWSLLIPAYGMVLVLLTYFTYFALALAGTPSFSDMRTITGESSVSVRPSARQPARPSARLATPLLAYPPSHILHITPSPSEPRDQVPSISQLLSPLSSLPAPGPWQLHEC